MIVSHKYKFIFVKTRKTAGSSIEKYLFPYLGPDDICTGSDRDQTPALNAHLLPDRNGHVGSEFIAEHFPTEYKNYYKFSVERNSWDKVVSYYYWYGKTKPAKVKNGFDHFVLTSGKKLSDWKMYTNKSIFCVDDVFLYEDLHNQFCKQTVIPYNNELLNTFCKSGIRKNKNYRLMYTNQETIDRVSSVFEKEIEKFGYKF